MATTNIKTGKRFGSLLREKYNWNFGSEELEGSSKQESPLPHLLNKV